MPEPSRGWSAGFLMVVAVASIAGCGMRAAQPAVALHGASYRVWVASESVDQISLIEFDGDEATVALRRPVGSMPVEIDGPHGIAASPDGRHIYVTLGHGVPFGWLLKMDADSGELIARTPLGLFPATASVTPDGAFGFVSNFNLHGDHVPSSISKVDLESMVEVTRTETCVMPHGSRVGPRGTRHYSVCMMDELLVEIDVSTGEVNRTFSLAPGNEGPREHPNHRLDESASASAICSPTWAEPSADGSSVFVTCNGADEVIEVDVDRWAIVRRFGTGENPYNLAATPDGRRLLVTLRNRTDPALEVYDLGTGERLARVPTSTTLPHGIAVSGDSRYAFVSVEGVGSEPGWVDVVELESASTVASVPVGQQATGIAVLPDER